MSPSKTPADTGGFRLARWLRAEAVAVLAACVVGCFEPVVRPQDDEADRNRYPVRTVGDVCTFGNADTVPIMGVGLVEGLEGTGAPAPAGGYRQMLEAELRKQRVDNPREVLSSPDFCMVLVSGHMPAGARPGDPIDLEISLPAGCKATSLRGGLLRRCLMFNYEYLRNLSPDYAGSDATLKGHPVAEAQGPVIVGFGEGDEGQKLTRGRIWGGAKCRVPRPFHLILNANQQQARIAANVATSINAAFQLAGFGAGSEVAKAENNLVVLLSPPAQYRLNLPRFLRVVRMVPLEDFSTAAAGDGPAVPYRTRLAEDLLDPAHAVTAALRLEALGSDSVPTLKAGLESPEPLVRFCAAEALAYLGSPSSGEELARVVRQQPYLRAYALTALASLDEAVCYVKLKELLEDDLDDEVRYGAFRALRSMDERQPAVSGETLNESFTVHAVPGGSKPFVHVSVTRRPEIVFFGEAPKLVPPFSIVAGEFALTAGADDVDRCVVSHYPLHGDGGTAGRFRCSLDVAEVLKAMATRGAGYPDVLEVLRQADSCRNLSCRVRHDALPQAARVEEIARAGRQSLEEKGKAKTEAERENEVALIKPDSDFGATPNLFAVTPSRRKVSEAERALLRERPGKDVKATAERK